MRAVVQRVSEAEVRIGEKVAGRIKAGYAVLVGIADTDAEKDADYIAEKLIGLRVFEDADEKMNLSVTDVSGEILLISQFTLYGDARKGRRPSFIRAARPETAIPLYEGLIERLSQHVHVETGEFGADMKVALVNDGPVTILLDSAKEF